MINIHEEVVVKCNAEQAFNLVNDINSYPLFVPSCEHAAIISQNSNAQIAELTLSRAGISKTFSTCNTLYPHHKIVMQLENGPFKSLSGEWVFSELDDVSTKIILYLNVSIEGFLLEKAVGAFLSSTIHSVMSSFIDRAAVIYE